MTRIVLLLLAVGGAAAAPIPAESDKDRVARLWGKVESPPGDYTAKPDGTRLTLRSLGWPVPFEYRTPAFRVAREVTGDFDMSVKLISLDAPDRTVKYESNPQTGAGLCVIGGTSSLSLYHWMAIHANRGFLQPGMQSCVWLARSHENGGGGSYLEAAEPTESLQFRIVRRDKAITVHSCGIAGQWKQWNAPDDVKLPDAVTVGVFVGHTTSQQVAATFADFKLGKPEPAKADKK